MSSAMHGYCIKLSELRSIMQNPPEDLIQELKAIFPDEFQPGTAEWGPSVGDALQDFLSGKGVNPDYQYQVVRELELICRLRGVPIVSPFFDDTGIMFIYATLGAGMGGGVCEPLAEHRPPVPMSSCAGGLPWVSYLTLEEIEAGLARPDKDIAGLNIDVADARDDLRVWLETAREHGSDLVVFVG